MGSRTVRHISLPRRTPAFWRSELVNDFEPQVNGDLSVSSVVAWDDRAMLNQQPVSSSMIVRRFIAICLLTAGFGLGLSILVAEGVRPAYSFGTGAYLPCVQEIQPTICLGPER